MDIVIASLRTILFYFLITLIYRIMGKREIGQLGVIDLIVSILIAELAAISIDNINESIYLSIFPIIILGIIEVSLSYISMKSSRIRNIFDGNPSVIINKGIINFKEMVKQRYNLDDLLSQLRSKKIKSISEVEYAVLESSGSLSVFKKNDNNSDYPLPLILDGKIEKETLKEINKDEEWIINTLKKDNLELKDIFYAFYKEKNLFIIRNSQLNK